jgi:DNA-binding FadR family transcriptional regulator
MLNESAKSLRRPALHEAVRDYVKQYIIDNELSAGDPLPPETQLARELGIGRSSVREAIKALESLGIVEVRHGAGLYVREYNFDPVLEAIGYGVRFDVRTLSEMAQIRFLLERAVIEDAVQLISAADLARLEALLATWSERVQEAEDHLDLDEEFHRILYGALHNDTLNKLLEVFWIAFENLDDPIIRETKPAAQELEDHRAILDAARSRDVALARQRLMEHFEHLQDRIRRATGQFPGDTTVPA